MQFSVSVGIGAQKQPTRSTESCGAARVPLFAVVWTSGRRREGGGREKGEEGRRGAVRLAGVHLRLQCMCLEPREAERRRSRRALLSTAAGDGVH